MVSHACAIKHLCRLALYLSALPVPKAYQLEALALKADDNLTHKTTLQRAGQGRQGMMGRTGHGHECHQPRTVQAGRIRLS